MSNCLETDKSFDSSFFSENDDENAERISTDCNEKEQESVIGKATNKNWKILKNVIFVCESLINANKKEENYNEKLNRQKHSKFNGKNIPKISINDYIERIFDYCEIEQYNTISALIYIDRLNINSNIILSEYNIHRLIFICILASIKFNSDTVYDNKYYAQVAGLSTDELFELETEFYKNIHFDLYITEDEYENYLKYMTSKE